MIYKCIYPENIEEGLRNLFRFFFIFFITFKISVTFISHYMNNKKIK